MKRELYQIAEQSTVFNVTGSRIDSVRTRSIVKSGCRVYSDGKVGIAGCIGEPTEETWQRAERSLMNGLPYPYPLETGKRLRDLREGSLDGAKFLSDSEALLAALHTAHPDFIFSNKIGCTETKVSIKNDEGLELTDRDLYYSCDLLMKDAASANIFDTELVYTLRHMNTNDILGQANEQASAFRNLVKLPDGDILPTAVSADQMMGLFYDALNGQLLGNKSSLLLNRMGTTCFSPAFSLDIDRSANDMSVPFFDTEGVVLPGDRHCLIRGGKLLCGFSDKSTAARYDLPATGAAGGAYDDVPTLGAPPLVMRSCGKTVKKLSDMPCLFLFVCSGGDWTNEGDYATPVQLAYLMQGGKLIGRLPEFAVSGNVFDLFGKDFVGVSADRYMNYSPLLFTQMKIRR